MTTTTFGSATITLLRDDDGNNSVWLAQPRLDERDLLGVAETDVNLLGFGSPELSCRVHCANQSQLTNLQVENGRARTLNDGESTRSCVLSIQGIRRMHGGVSIVTCRFKQV